MVDSGPPKTPDSVPGSHRATNSQFRTEPKVPIEGSHWVRTGYRYVPAVPWVPRFVPWFPAVGSSYFFKKGGGPIFFSRFFNMETPLFLNFSVFLNNMIAELKIG